MKKLLLTLCAVCFFFTACEKQSQAVSETEIDRGKIYFFFSDTCPHCHDALRYIERKYPDLQYSMVNVANPAGYDLFVKCARKFNLGRNIGTPLFCMGSNYLMGWAPEYEARFDQYVKPFSR